LIKNRYGERINKLDLENKIFIGNREIHNLEKYNLVLGNFKKEDLANIENDTLFKILENLDSIPITLFIDSLDKKSKEFNDLKKINELSTLLNRKAENIEQNFKLISDYNDLIGDIINIFKLLILELKKNKAINLLKISEQYKKSSEKLAIKDLIEKLQNSIKKNQNRLKYLEKDYLEKKNQFEKIQEKIQMKNGQIKNLNNQKKQCFRYINYITRDMEANSVEPSALGFDQIEVDKDLSNAEKIRALQIKAQEIQYDTNKIKKSIKQDKIDLESFRPQYELIERDYLKLKNEIKQDQNRLFEKQAELNKLVNENELVNASLTAIPLRTPGEIEDEIDELDSQIQNVLDSRKFTENYLPENILFLIEKVSDKLNLTQKLKTDIEKDDNLEVDLIFKAYHKTEQLLNEFEVKINPLLREINLNISLNLSISKESNKFLIEPEFQRNKEKNLKINDLTTPEKVYITICFIIVIQLIKKLKQIIVSNTFLPEKFNKKGSIFRTIKKLLNLVRNDQSFKDISLTFIIKNFEPKKMIHHLNVIKINEIEN
jgi:hypothetical protein